MSNSSFHLSKFSPLRTPDVHKHQKRNDSDDDYVSSSSIGSSVTNDVLRLSQSIQKKLKKKTSLDSSPEKGSGENLFLTQRFPEATNKIPKESSSPRKKSPSKSQTKKSIDTDKLSESDSHNNANKAKSKTAAKKLSIKLEKKESKSSDSSSSESDSSDMDESKIRSLVEKLRARSVIKKGSESSESESDSGPSGIDEAKTQRLAEKLRSENAHKNDNNSSEPESKSGDDEGKELKNDDLIDFSQDLFSQVTKDSGNFVSQSETKSPRKSSNMQKDILVENRGRKRNISESIIKEMFGSSDSSPAKQRKLKSKGSKERNSKLAKADNKRERSLHDLSDSESDNNKTVVSSSKLNTSEKRSIAQDNDLEDDSDSDNSRNIVDQIPENYVASSPRSVQNSESGNETDKSLRNDNEMASDSDFGTEEKIKNNQSLHRENKNSIKKSRKRSGSSDVRTSESSESSVENAKLATKKTKVSSPKASTPSKGKGSNKQKRKSETNESVTSLDMRKTWKGNTKSPETPKEKMRQSKITDHCLPPIESPRHKKMQLRYKAPAGFEAMDDVEKYVTENVIKGKQLWLLQTPADFDINTLDNKELDLEGVQTICVGDETEKQYEVVSRLCGDSEGPGYNFVAVDDQGNHKLGERISGQIQVLDWIPGIAPVRIEIPTQQKHEIPDNLKVRYEPFGAVSPKRIDIADLEGEKIKKKHSRTHSKGKKKKKREKELFDL